MEWWAARFVETDVSYRPRAEWGNPGVQWNWGEKACPKLNSNKQIWALFCWSQIVAGVNSNEGETKVSENGKEVHPFNSKVTKLSCSEMGHGQEWSVSLRTNGLLMGTNISQACISTAHLAIQSVGLPELWFKWNSILDKQIYAEDQPFQRVLVVGFISLTWSLSDSTIYFLSVMGLLQYVCSKVSQWTLPGGAGSRAGTPGGQYILILLHLLWRGWTVSERGLFFLSECKKNPEILTLVRSAVQVQTETFKKMPTGTNTWAPVRSQWRSSKYAWWSRGCCSDGQNWWLLMVRWLLLSPLETLTRHWHWPDLEYLQRDYRNPKSGVWIENCNLA